jgi:putative GTP pyrophosphokinase
MLLKAERTIHMPILFPQDEFNKLKRLMVLYNCALMDINTRMDILLEDFKHLQAYNPIEHVKSRIKSPESIAEKLHKSNLDITADNARKRVTDIAGLRCICSYARDIYFIAGVFKKLPDINVLSEKDFVTSPKPSGYRSFHMVLEVPVYLSRETLPIPVEVQIRTQAMDFWAALEHKVRYKYEQQIPKNLSDELNACAERIAELDDRMFTIHDTISLFNPL